MKQHSPSPEHSSGNEDDGDYDYDLIVIGGGPVGENVADYATQRGLHVALVESELLGGECSYWACMPSKALVRSGHALRAARRVAGARQAATGRLNASAVFCRRNEFTSHWDDTGQVSWLESVGVDLIRGHGRLAGAHRVQVGERIYRARTVALATGSSPVIPDIPGLAEASPWGTREATAAEHVPPRLAVLGGGVAGTELAFAFSSLGSEVTVLARSGLLGKEEPFVGELVTESLRAEGVDVRTGVSPMEVTRHEDGSVSVALDDGTTLGADELVVSTGRRPRTRDLGLETLGLETLGLETANPEDLPDVDDTMLVAGTAWLYAVGDVNGRALLTHQGKYQARAAGEIIAARLNDTPVLDQPWGAHVATADHAAVPRVVFSDPEVAAVGLTEENAHAAGYSATAVEVDLGAVAGAALHADGYSGRAKLVIDQDRKVILGATFVGQDAAELVHAATIAVVGEVPISRLWHAVPVFPTMNEVWLRLLETHGRP